MARIILSRKYQKVEPTIRIEKSLDTYTGAEKAEIMKAEMKESIVALRYFSSKMSKKRTLKPMAIVIGSYWTHFCSQKLKTRILETFGYNRTALHVTLQKIHSMFCALFLKIALSAAELMAFGNLGAAIWHRWTIICRVPPKISVTPTSHKQLTL